MIRYNCVFQYIILVVPYTAEDFPISAIFSKNDIHIFWTDTKKSCIELYINIGTNFNRYGGEKNSHCSNGLRQ